METISLFDHVMVRGQVLIIYVDDFAEAFPEEPDEAEVIEILVKALLDYDDVINCLEINKCTWSAPFCRDIFQAVFETVAGFAVRPTTIRLKITDESFETFNDLKHIVTTHRYITHWILTFNVDEIPKSGNQILKPFHDAHWIKKLTIITA